jgi:YbbR domain-containing protein
MKFSTDRLRVWLDLAKEYAKDYVLENTGLKVLALLITGVLWLSVASRPIGEITLYNVPIEFRNLPETGELTVSKYDIPSLSARVYMRGPRDALDSLRANELSAFADLSGVEPGERVRELQLDSSRLPANVVARVVEPRTIRMTVERVVEKAVPVRPRFDGAPPPGFEVIGHTVTPATVHLVGAASQIASIKEVSTETIRLAGKTEPFSVETAIDIGSPSVSLKKEELGRRVMLTVNVGEERSERIIEPVPVVLVGAPATSRVDPAWVRVTVFGARSVVERLTPADMSVSVEYQWSSARPRIASPAATVSPAYAGDVAVTSIEPKTVWIR